MKLIKDYYTALGVSRTSTEREIGVAFRRLALKFHPDRNKGNPQAEERFKELSEAYAVLSDPQKRAQYDLFAPHSSQQSSQRERTSFDSSSVDDFLGSYSGREHRRVHTPPPDILNEMLRGLDDIIRKQRERYIIITHLPQRRDFARRMVIKAQLQRIFINTADTYTEKRNANIKIRKEENGTQIETVEQFDLYLGLPLEEKIEFDIRLERSEIYGTVVHDGTIRAMHSDVDLRLKGDIRAIMHKMAGVSVKHDGFVVSHDKVFDTDIYRPFGVKAEHCLQIHAAQSEINLKYRK